MSWRLGRVGRGVKEEETAYIPYAAPFAWFRGKFDLITVPPHGRIGQCGQPGFRLDGHVRVRAPDHLQT